MTVNMSDEAVWAMLAAGTSGVFVSLRRSGAPFATPVWYVVQDRVVYIRTTATAAKVGRIRHDDRVVFLVEDGRAWAELRAVHISGRAHVVDEPELAARIGQLVEDKYATLRTPAAQRPSATNRHYAERVVIRVVPESIVSWDNSLLRAGSQ